MSWARPTLTVVSIALFSLYWLLKRRSASFRTARLCLYAALATYLAALVDYRRFVLRLCESSRVSLLNATPVQHLKMVLTLGAVLWLLHRSWQTLWKPVPELISILGVDIPQAPDVCLTGIGVHSATLSWTRPATSRGVQKYMIHVNGVYVGDSQNNDTAITVTGLKPNHFYNIRVLAVGSDNFRAGGPLIRVRTFGKDGLPHFDNTPPSSALVHADRYRGETGDESDDSSTLATSFPTIEAALSIEDSAAPSRDVGSAASALRRSTAGRRSSPSLASGEQLQKKAIQLIEPPLTLAALNKKFEGIRKDIDETLTFYSKDENDFLQQEEELKKGREKKRQMLKEKEEYTTQLRTSIRSTMEQMRAAEKERAKMEQLVKDKESKARKVQDSIAKSEQEVENMMEERQDFERQKAEAADTHQKKMEQLDGDNSQLLEQCLQLEAELKEKGSRLKDLKANKDNMPEAEDEASRQNEARTRQEWEMRRRDLSNRLAAETRSTQQLNMQIRNLGEQLAMLQQQANQAYMNPPGSSKSEYGPSPVMQHQQRLGHQGASLSVASFPSPDRMPPAEPSRQPPAATYGRPAFTNTLYMNPSASGAHGPQMEAELKASSGLLSPSAQTLLPSNIFEENDEAEASHRQITLPLREAAALRDEGLRSPSFNVYTSPHGSAQNLPYARIARESDSGSLAPRSPPSAPSAPGNKFASLLSTFQRGRPKASEEAGLPIGSLRPGQSQSFPNATEEVEPLANKRRLNFSSWVGRHSVGSESLPSASSPSTSNPFGSLRVHPLRSPTSSAVSDQEQKRLSRPPSLASLDQPRPSTDSGSIWRVPGESVRSGKNYLWSSENGRWASKSASRRPSGQDADMLTTSLASADDEILDESDLRNPETLPSQVGVIGSRRSKGSRADVPRLNPNAPTFMASIFRKDKDNEKEASAEKTKSKGKEKMQYRDKDSVCRSKQASETLPSIEISPSVEHSPSESRASRDTRSVHTQPSFSASQESLPLETPTMSGASTAPHATPATTSKDSESAVRKLFRKGSSGKFPGLSSRLSKDSSSLFKRGSVSTSVPEKGASTEHRWSVGDVEQLEEGAALFRRSYDSIASSPPLGLSRSRESREGSSRMSSWRFSMSSKKRVKDATDGEDERTEVTSTQEEE